MVTPTVHIDVRQLVSTEAATRQEAALEHVREALRLVSELLELGEVLGAHRVQLEEGCEYLEQAVDYLGPVEEFETPREVALMKPGDNGKV